MRSNMLIVDGHAHTFGSPEVASKIINAFNRKFDIDFENPGDGTIEDTLAKMNEYGIDYTVMANFSDPKRSDESNRWTLDIAQNEPSLIPLISLHPEMPGDFAKLMREYMELGARGIKLHPMAQHFQPTDERLKVVYSIAADYNWPIVFHCGRVANARINSFSDLAEIIPVVENNPSTTYILTHMVDGNETDLLFAADQFKNIYFDTSIVMSGYEQIKNSNEPSWSEDDQFIRVVELVGADRFLFGSDHPWGHPGDDLDRFLKMKMDDDSKSKILGLNARKIFNIMN